MKRIFPLEADRYPVTDDEREALHDLLADLFGEQELWVTDKDET